jgi:hypothetical protein
MLELVMKCEVCLELLEEYLDGELAPGDRDEVGAHLITCGGCAEQFAALTAEQELFARYDRELQVSVGLWNRIEDQIAPAPETSGAWWLRVAAALLLVIGLGSVYLLSRSKDETIASIKLPEEQPVVIERHAVVAEKKKTGIKRVVKSKPVDNPGVISADLGFDIDERETAKHIERTENLLRSIRNYPVPDSDEEIDVTYDKALSRRLLIENVVLRREAEMKAKFPTKTLLADLEPFLIDIANLPDHAKPEEVRAINERVQKTEIVAALLDYQDGRQDRGPNNR